MKFNNINIRTIGPQSFTSTQRRNRLWGTGDVFIQPRDRVSKPNITAHYPSNRREATLRAGQKPERNRRRDNKNKLGIAGDRPH